MSQAQVYDEIMQVLQQAAADHTTYALTIETGNRSVVDQSTQVDPYLKAEIKFLTGDQLDLGTAPKTEQWGQIWLSACCKEGDGELELMKLLDFLAPYFAYKSLGLTQCRAVVRVQPKTINGVYRLPALVNFFYHE